MLIREFTTDLPISDAPEGTKIDPQDIVVSVQNKGNCMVGVRLRKTGKYGAHYTVTLRIPEPAFQTTLLALLRKEGMTLREIGEIDVEV